MPGLLPLGFPQVLFSLLMRLNGTVIVAVGYASLCFLVRPSCLVAFNLGLWIGKPGPRIGCFGLVG